MSDILKGFEENRKFQKEVSRQILELKESQVITGAQILQLKESQAITDAQILQLKASQAITDAQIQQLKESQAITDAHIQQLKESQVKTDEQLNRTDEQLNRTDEQLNRTDEQILELKDFQNKTFAKLDSIGKQLGSMGHNIGDAAEELFYRSLKESPVLGHIKFDSVHRCIRKANDDQEIDILLVNGDCVALIEVKYKAHPTDVHDIALKKVHYFRQSHRKYKNHKLYFGIASMATNTGLIKAAKEEGIFLLTQKGNHLIVSNNQVRIFD